MTEHDEIRRCAEERNAKPAHGKRTGGGDDVGMLGLDFPGYSSSESPEEISWDEWFEEFDETKSCSVSTGRDCTRSEKQFQ